MLPDRPRGPPSRLHEARLRAVHDALVSSGARTVLDLGCGSGPLMIRLVRSGRFKKVVGVDISTRSLQSLERKLESIRSERCHAALIHASFMDRNIDLAGFEAAILVETIEHIAPDKLSALENAVFARYRPQTVIITTPNSEFNDSLGVPEYRFRHRDHKFEWKRQKFRSWAERVAKRNRYDVLFRDIGRSHPAFGSATQMAQFVAAVAAS
jgi:3' terminal RNA ribose 2'-O-methyltransferase Hen1